MSLISRSGANVHHTPCQLVPLCMTRTAAHHHGQVYFCGIALLVSEGRRNLGGPSSKHVADTLRGLAYSAVSSELLLLLLLPLMISNQCKIFVCKECSTERILKLREELCVTTKEINENLTKSCEAIVSSGVIATPTQSPKRQSTSGYDGGSTPKRRRTLAAVEREAMSRCVVVDSPCVSVKLICYS